MPLTRFTLRDQLVSEEIHMLEVAQGLTRPSHIAYYVPDPDGIFGWRAARVDLLGVADEFDPDERPVELALRNRSASTVDVYRETKDHDRKPVMTSDDTDLRASLIGALKDQRYMDGRAYGICVAFFNAWDDIDKRAEGLPVDVIVEGELQAADVIVEASRLLSGWEEEKPPPTDKERERLIAAARASCQPIVPEHVMGYSTTSDRTGRSYDHRPYLKTYLQGARTHQSLWLYACDRELFAITKRLLVDRGLWQKFSLDWARLVAFRNRARQSLSTRSEDYLVRNGKLVKGSVLLDPHFLDWQGPRKALRSARNMRPNGKGPNRADQMAAMAWERAYMPWHKRRHRLVLGADGETYRETGWVRPDRWQGKRKIKGGERWVKVRGRWTKEVRYTVLPEHLGGYQRVPRLGTPSERIELRPLIRLLHPVQNAQGRMRVEELGLWGGRHPVAPVTAHAKGTRTSWVGKYRLYASAAACLNVRVYGPRGIARPKPVVPVEPDGDRLTTVSLVESDLGAVLAEHVPHAGPPRSLIGDTTPPAGVDPRQGSRTREQRAADRAAANA